MLRLPFTIGVVTTLLLFSGWLRTERGTVMRAGNFPCSVKQKESSVTLTDERIGTVPRTHKCRLR